MMANQTAENFSKLRNFYSENKQFLFNLQFRFEEEWKYEEPEEYEKAIREKAEKFNLTVKKVYCNYQNFSINIKFVFEDKRIGCIDILKTKTKIYMQ